MSARELTALELEVNPGCWMCSGTGRVVDRDSLYAGWRYCDCVIKRRRVPDVEKGGPDEG